MKVVWTDTARANLRAIHAYIAQHSEHYARRTVDRLTSRSRQIARFPRSGRLVKDSESDDVREVIEGSYRIVYQIYAHQIDVLAVFHTSMDSSSR